MYRAVSIDGLSAGTRVFDQKDGIVVESEYITSDEFLVNKSDTRLTVVTHETNPRYQSRMRYDLENNTIEI